MNKFSDIDEIKKDTELYRNVINYLRDCITNSKEMKIKIGKKYSNEIISLKMMEYYNRKRELVLIRENKTPLKVPFIIRFEKYEIIVDIVYNENNFKFQ